MAENEKLTLSMSEAAKALGISRGLAYSLATQKILPVIRLGSKRLVVPKRAIERMLSEASNQTTETQGQSQGEC